MKLSQLIDQADNIYQLRLRPLERRELQRRLISAGVDRSIRPNHTSRVLDAVLTTTDNIRNRRLTTAATRYRSLKREATAQHDGCPRCRQPMQQVNLVSERQANYCQGCCIALPIKA